MKSAVGFVVKNTSGVFRVCILVVVVVSTHPALLDARGPGTSGSRVPYRLLPALEEGGALQGLRPEGPRSEICLYVSAREDVCCIVWL